MIMKKKLPYVIILLLGMVFFIAPFKTALLISKSDSLPYKFYFLVKGRNWQKYDLVAIKNFATKYTYNQHFTKKIVGVAGDLVAVDGEYVLVNGVKYKSKEKTRDHKKLTPILAQIIPPKHFFVVAEHKDSFDSRYQEFGLIREDYIEGKVYPIW